MGAACRLAVPRAITPERVFTAITAAPPGLPAASLNVTEASRLVADPIRDGADTLAGELKGYCSISGVILIETGPLTRSLGWPSLSMAVVYAMVGFQSTALRSIGVSVTSFTVTLSCEGRTLGSVGCTGPATEKSA